MIFEVLVAAAATITAAATTAAVVAVFPVVSGVALKAF